MKYDAISEKLNNVAMNGFATEEYGSCQEEGFWSALIITENLFGIIQEDDQGFVDYRTFDTEKQARDHWDQYVKGWESYYSFDREREEDIDNIVTGYCVNESIVDIYN